MAGGMELQPGDVRARVFVPVRMKRPYDPALSDQSGNGRGIDTESRRGASIAPARGFLCSEG